MHSRLRAINDGVHQSISREVQRFGCAFGKDDIIRWRRTKELRDFATRPFKGFGGFIGERV